MKKLLTIIMASMFLTACSISEPRLSIGKKCTLSCLLIHMVIR